MARQPVRLNVYDMYWINDYLTSMGVGVFHSGVEVYGVEYAYGGHPLPFSGVFENAPRDSEELGENFRFKAGRWEGKCRLEESILLGYTDFSNADTTALVQTLGRDFYGDQYHLISKNCNHFSGVFARTLCGVELPSWVNRLAFISGSIPFLERCLPKEWLTPVALQHALDERDAAAAAAAAAAARTSANSTNVPSPTNGLPRSASSGGNSLSNFFSSLKSSVGSSKDNSSSSSSTSDSSAARGLLPRHRDKNS